MRKYYLPDSKESRGTKFYTPTIMDSLDKQHLFPAIREKNQPKRKEILMQHINLISFHFKIIFPLGMGHMSDFVYFKSGKF